MITVVWTVSLHNWVLEGRLNRVSPVDVVNMSSPNVGCLRHQLVESQVQKSSGDGVVGLLDSADIEVPHNEGGLVIFDPIKDGISSLNKACTTGMIDIDTVNSGKGENGHLEVSPSDHVHMTACTNNLFAVAGDSLAIGNNSVVTLEARNPKCFKVALCSQ